MLEEVCAHAVGCLPDTVNKLSGEIPSGTASMVDGPLLQHSKEDSPYCGQESARLHLYSDKFVSVFYKMVTPVWRLQNQKHDI